MAVEVLKKIADPDVVEGYENYPADVHRIIIYMEEQLHIKPKKDYVIWVRGHIAIVKPFNNDLCHDICEILRELKLEMLFSYINACLVIINKENGIRI